MDEEAAKARRERASENNCIKQMVERLLETGSLDPRDQLFLGETLLKDRGLAAFE
jgi:hypothetical protein